MKELAKALKKKIVFGSASAGHNDANAATIKSNTTRAVAITS